MTLLDTLAADLFDNVVKGAARKAADGFVQKGYITSAQEPELIAGFMDEVQIGLAMWKQSQAPPPK
ncbi:MAG TPA: hypothetical protein VGL58_06380 [Caulobacteraceae bacterium]|jgi:hypothetical protein